MYGWMGWLERMKCQPAIEGFFLWNATEQMQGLLAECKGTLRHLLKVVPQARHEKASKVWPWPESMAFSSLRKKPVVRKKEKKRPCRVVGGLSYSFANLIGKKLYADKRKDKVIF